MHANAFAVTGNDLNTVAAEYNGIFNYQNITAPVAQCSTGNCTWPTVPSLAVCGSCTDMTAALKYSCVSANRSTAYGLSPPNCTYTLSEGQAIGYPPPPPGYTFWTTFGLDAAAYLVVGGYKTKYYNESSYLYLDTWLMIDASSRSVSATACGLWFCAQAYETSVSNGVSTQKTIGTWSETIIKTNNDLENSILPWVNFTNIPADIQLNTTYSIGTSVMSAFEQNPIFSDANVRYGTDVLDWYDYSSTTVRTLMSIADYDTWIELFALGMSNNVRSTGTASIPADTYAGTVLTSVAHVHVRWGWLAFPASMVAASLVFLLACIWQTHQLHVPPWKGDALALLRSGLDEDIQSEFTSGWEVRQEKVRLENIGGSPVFRRVAGENS